MVPPLVILRQHTNRPFKKRFLHGCLCEKMLHLKRRMRSHSLENKTDGTRHQMLVRYGATQGKSKRGVK